MAPPLLPFVIASAVIAAIHIVENMSDKDRAEAEERAANANFGPSYVPPSAIEEIMKMADQRSIADDIEKLGNLLRDGLITQEEFNTLKRKVIES